MDHEDDSASAPSSRRVPSLGAYAFLGALVFVVLLAYVAPYLLLHHARALYDTLPSLLTAGERKVSFTSAEGRATVDDRIASACTQVPILMIPLMRPPNTVLVQHVEGR